VFGLSFREGVAPLEHLFSEKLFDIALALFGTWLGYLLAKRHLEHFVSSIVEKMDTKYLDLNRQIAFHKAVGAMLPELPNFHIRQSTGFSSDVATAVAEFTRWSAALEPTYTPAKSMELVGKEAHILAAGLIEKDMGFKEEEPAPNYEWTIGVGGLPAGWEVEDAPRPFDLRLAHWNYGASVRANERDGTNRYLDSLHLGVEHERRALRGVCRSCELQDRGQACNWERRWGTLEHFLKARKRKDRQDARDHSLGLGD
jgi:hypothetical protein